jgi:protein-S-isoprenylcysteine O-methyltransferase Ste14
MTKDFDFKKNTIKQIRIWAWAAAVLPITALAGLFFVWRFAPNSVLGYAFITGETVMFGIAVVWWWWAMYTMRNLVRHWDETREKVKEVSKDVKEIRSVVLETLSDDK